MKKSLLVVMVAIGLGSVAACNRDNPPGTPNRSTPDRSVPPRAQNTSPSNAVGASGAQSGGSGGQSANQSGAPGAQSGGLGSSNTSPRPGQGTESQVAQLSFDTADTNKDGVITQNEALAIPGIDFASADKDNSHALSRQEFDAAMAKTRPGG